MFNTFQERFEKFTSNKDIIGNIFRIQAYDLIMHGYSCMGFIDFMLSNKWLIGFTSLFPPNNF